MTRDLIVLFSITVLFMLAYSVVYPLHIPLNGYFIIEKIPRHFWVSYTILLLLLYLLILAGKTFRISRSLLIVLSYVLLYSCSLRTFATLHFSGFMGSDSPNFVGLTQYWILHDHLDLAKVSYGDNPGLFILGKIIVSITDLDVNLYTNIIGVIWITTVYLIFSLMTSHYIAVPEIENLTGYNRRESTSMIISLVATLSYFVLAVPFSVNFQYAPQTFALVLLLFYFFLLGSFLIKPGSSQIYVLILITYAAIQISHPFMFMFGISTIALLISARWFIKLRSSLTNPLHMKRPGLVTLLLVMITLSSVYILYQTVLLQRRVGEVIRSILEAFELRFPVEYFERLSTPALPHYEFGYYLIAVIHSVTWVVIAVIITIFVLKTLLTRVPKYYELSIIVGSLVALLTFMSTFTVQEFVIRAGQVFLFGAMLLAIKSTIVKNNWFKTTSLRLLIPTLLGLLIMSSFLAFIRYTWYVQPPHLSHNDIIMSRTLEELMDLTKYSESRSKLMIWNSLNAYHNSRLYASYPVSYSPIMLVSLNITIHDIVNYDILWSNILELEIIKYIGERLILEEIVHSHNVVLNAQHALLLTHVD